MKPRWRVPEYGLDQPLVISYRDGETARRAELSSLVPVLL